MKPWVRILAFLLCTVVLLSMLLSAAFLLASAAHICTGNGCPICARMELAAQLLRKPGFTVMLGFLLIELCCVLLPVRLRILEHQNTPVRMKVKLSC